jgi:hypothetical protein
MSVWARTPLPTAAWPKAPPQNISMCSPGSALRGLCRDGCVCPVPVPRLNAPTLDQADEDEDNGHNQKDVDKATHRVGRHKSKQPQDDEN